MANMDTFPIVRKRFTRTSGHLIPSELPLLRGNRGFEYKIDGEYVVCFRRRILQSSKLIWRETLSNYREVRHRMIPVADISPVAKFFSDFSRGSHWGISSTDSNWESHSILVIGLNHADTPLKSVILHYESFDRTKTRNYTKTMKLLHAYRELLGLPIKSDQFQVTG